MSPRVLETHDQQLAKENTSHHTNWPFITMHSLHFFRYESWIYHDTIPARILYVRWLRSRILIRWSNMFRECIFPARYSCPRGRIRVYGYGRLRVSNVPSNHVSGGVPRWKGLVGIPTLISTQTLDSRRKQMNVLTTPMNNVRRNKNFAVNSSKTYIF